MFFAFFESTIISLQNFPRELFDSYEKCENGDDIIAAQNKYIDDCKNEINTSHGTDDEDDLEQLCQ